MSNRYHEEWTDQLSDYLADELGQGARARLEEHLGACVRCREALSGLRDVVALAHGADDLDPPRDLWPDISAALASVPGPGTEEGDVIQLPTAARRSVRLAVSPARLAMAAAVLVLLSVGTTWAVASSGAATTGADPVASGPFGDGVASMAADEADIPPDLAAELGVLEDVLAGARANLDSATVVVLERNMRTIQTAIDDSKRALTADPGNAFLAEHLERMYRRKLVYMQEAVRVAEWAS